MRRTLPKVITEYSIVPMRMGSTPVLPATRTMKREPSPSSKMSSGASRESEHVRMIANGFWPWAVLMRCTESRRGNSGLPWTKRLFPARRRFRASSGVFGNGAASGAAANACADEPVIDSAPAASVPPAAASPLATKVRLEGVRDMVLPPARSGRSIRNPRVCARDTRRSGLLPGHDPHGEELRASAVGVAERRAGAVDLMLPRLSSYLHRRLREAQHARRADRVRRQHAARHV